MMQLRPQYTLRDSISIDGFGYWSGKDIRVELLPAGENQGITFIRKDLPGAPRIAATVDNRVEVPRRTVLRSEKATVEMVEHLMAALSGMQVDNCQVMIDTEEMPGCDGSSWAFLQAIQQVGKVEQSASKEVLVVREPIRLGEADSWIAARPLPNLSDQTFLLKAHIDYSSDAAIGRQTYELSVTPESFAKELAPARTFVTKAEAEWLQTRGIAMRPSYQDLLIFDEEGPIENQLRYANECVRHKALDMVGDFALSGCEVVGYFIGHCSGHRLNAELIRLLLREGQRFHGHRLSA
ncbi:UDP-3-O-acyl-N-acetylglucosamine deacetylase [Planctomycetales bacterium 10988]|nr:UDP-3-O-acyl-N-acetylglucosamine deacetylase [Planctomycetales bacterium 10988]